MYNSLSPKMDFGAIAKTSGVSYSNQANQSHDAALTNADFQRSSCAKMQLGIGPRDHQECPHRVTFDFYAPSDSSALEIAILAAYRQLHGNCYVMSNERATELEAQLSNGRISMREFVRGLVKRDFYKDRFIMSVCAGSSGLCRSEGYPQSFAGHRDMFIRRGKRSKYLQVSQVS